MRISLLAAGALLACAPLSAQERAAAPQPNAPEQRMGDPVPGITVSLELNAMRPGAGEQSDRTVNLSGLSAAQLESRALTERMANVARTGRMSIPEAERAFVARQVAELANTLPGEAAPSSVRYCFETWCTDVTLGGTPRR